MSANFYLFILFCFYMFSCYYNLKKKVVGWKEVLDPKEDEGLV